jgi:hypothetical protein
MSSGKIFKSSIFLSFDNNNLESEFEAKKNRKFQKYALLQIGFYFLINIVLVTVNALFLTDLFSRATHYRLLLISSYLFLFITTISLALNFFVRRVNILKWSYYITLIVISLNFFNFRFTINRIVNYQVINWFSVLFELLYKTIQVTVLMISFKEKLLINLTIIILEWSIFFHSVPSEMKTSWILNHIFTSATYLLFSILIYFIDRRLRIAYYYSFKADMNSLWLKGVLENMNGGFLSVKNNRISYINPFLKLIIEETLPHFFFQACETLIIRNFKLKNRKSSK